MQEKDVIRTLTVGDLGADEDGKARALMVIPAGKFFKVTAVYISSDATVTGDNTNYNTVYIQNNNGTYNNAVIVSKAFTLASDVTQAPASLGTISTDASKYVVGNASAVRTVYLVEKLAGAGLAIPGAAIHIVGNWIPS